MNDFTILYINFNKRNFTYIVFFHLIIFFFYLSSHPAHSAMSICKGDVLWSNTNHDNFIVCGTSVTLYKVEKTVNLTNKQKCKYKQFY